MGKTVCEKTSLLPRSCVVSGHLATAGVSLLTSQPPATGKGSLFAGITAAVVLALGWLLLQPVVSGIYSFRWNNVRGEQAPEILGGVVALSLVSLGGATLLAGIWLGLVE